MPAVTFIRVVTSVIALASVLAACSTAAVGPPAVAPATTMPIDVYKESQTSYVFVLWSNRPSNYKSFLKDTWQFTWVEDLSETWSGYNAPNIAAANAFMSYANAAISCTSDCVTSPTTQLLRQHVAAVRGEALSTTQHDTEPPNITPKVTCISPRNQQTRRACLTAAQLADVTDDASGSALPATKVTGCEPVKVVGKAPNLLKCDATDDKVCISWGSNNALQRKPAVQVKLEATDDEVGNVANARVHVTVQPRSPTRSSAGAGCTVVPL